MTEGKENTIRARSVPCQYSLRSILTRRSREPQALLVPLHFPHLLFGLSLEEVERVAPLRGSRLRRVVTIRP